MKVNVNCACTCGFEMDYFSFGNGKKSLVLLPGLSLLPVTPMAKAVAMQYREFHNDYTFYLFDRKRTVNEGYTIEQMADDTVQAMRNAGIEETILMGCSQGGMIAQVIASKYPHMINKLILCSTTDYSDNKAKAVLENWLTLAKKGNMTDFNRDVFQHVYSKDYYEKFAESFKLAEGLGTPKDVAKFIPLATACQSFDSRSILNNIKCPVLVVGSNIDNVLGGKGSERLASALNAELIMYDNYGHAAYDEAPDLHERILKFLAD